MFAIFIIAIKLLIIAIGLVIVSIPIFFVLAVRRFLPDRLRQIANIAAVPFVIVSGGIGALGVFWLFGIDFGFAGDCFEKHYSEKISARSPTGKTATVSSGVCVTGLSAVNSYDGVDIEIAHPASDRRTLIFKGYGLAHDLIDLEWRGDGVLIVYLRKAIPVGESLHNVDGVVIEYHVSPEALVPVASDPEGSERFKKWAAEHAVID